MYALGEALHTIHRVMHRFSEPCFTGSRFAQIGSRFAFCGTFYQSRGWQAPRASLSRFARLQFQTLYHINYQNKITPHKFKKPSCVSKRGYIYIIYNIIKKINK